MKAETCFSTRARSGSIDKYTGMPRRPLYGKSASHTAAQPSARSASSQMPLMTKRGRLRDRPCPLTCQHAGTDHGKAEGLAVVVEGFERQAAGNHPADVGESVVHLDHDVVPCKRQGVRGGGFVVAEGLVFSQTGLCVWYVMPAAKNSMMETTWKLPRRIRGNPRLSLLHSSHPRRALAAPAAASNASGAGGPAAVAVRYRYRHTSERPRRIWGAIFGHDGSASAICLRAEPQGRRRDARLGS